jgi:hypothetical protein
LNTLSNPVRKFRPRAFASLMVWKTATSTFFVALVSMWLPRKYWSASTPMPQTRFSFAALRAPRPQPPATWNTTREPRAIWFSAVSLHFA